MTVSLPARLIVVLALGSYAGCTTFSPALGDIVRDPSTGGCRDTVTGRFASCPSDGPTTDGPTTETVLIGLGIAAGLALVGGLIYAATRPSSNSSSTVSSPVKEAATETVRSRCYNENGNEYWLDAPQTCQSRGLRSTPPPRRPSIRCYGADGTAREVAATTCDGEGMLTLPPSNAESTARCYANDGTPRVIAVAGPAAIVCRNAGLHAFPPSTGGAPTQRPE